MSALTTSSSRGRSARTAERAASPGANQQTALGGVFSRRERWGLTLRGWLILLVVLGATLVAMVLGAYPFLAVTSRTSSKYLAVEGWVHDYAISVATAEFQSGGYEKVFSTGGPIQGIGGYRGDYSTAASIGASRLITAGVPADRVQMVPSRISVRDRTFSSAVALREWLHAQHVTIRNLNVLTEDVHARRTRLLFQEAFGDSVTVGIVAVPNPDYDATHWWRYSEGVREVIGEVIAYVYAKFFFFPPADRADESTHSSIQNPN